MPNQQKTNAYEQETSYTPPPKKKKHMFPPFLGDHL